VVGALAHGSESLARDGLKSAGGPCPAAAGTCLQVAAPLLVAGQHQRWGKRTGRAGLRPRPRRRTGITKREAGGLRERVRAHANATRARPRRMHAARSHTLALMHHHRAASAQQGALAGSLRVAKPGAQVYGRAGRPGRRWSSDCNAGGSPGCRSG
jgi:hypothetical protein